MPIFTIVIIITFNILYFIMPGTNEKKIHDSSDTFSDEPIITMRGFYF